MFRLPVDDAGKALVYDDEPCECGHRSDEHDDLERCCSEDGCECEKFRYPEPTYDDLED